MALAKNHQTFIEAELDREVETELNSRSQQKSSYHSKSQSNAELNQHKQSIQQQDLQSVQQSEKQPKKKSMLRSIYWQHSKIIIALVWNALLGLFITVQYSLVNILNRLVKKGRRFREKIEVAKIKQQATERAVNTAKSKQKPAPKPASMNKVHHLESNIENTLERGRSNTLHWIGVPSQAEFNELKAQLERLSEKVEFLEQELQQSGWVRANINRTVIG